MCIHVHSMLTHCVVSLSADSLLDLTELLQVNVVTLVFIIHLECYFKLSSGLYVYVCCSVMNANNHRYKVYMQKQQK